MKKIYLILLVAAFACQSKHESPRQFIHLDGEWAFALDSTDIGVGHQWYLSSLNDVVELPGTTDSNKKGTRNRDTTTLHLNREYPYVGPAWYQKKIHIPESFRNKHVRLVLERTKSTTVWVDSVLVGGSRMLQTPQQFDVSALLTPGEHTLTIRIDNSLELTPYSSTHIYAEDTQTNWNGIIGDLYIEASEKTRITSLQVYPDVANKKIEIEIEIDNQLNIDNIDIELLVEKNMDGKTTRLKPKKVNVACEKSIRLDYSLGDQCSLWDEFQQPLYQLTATLSNGTTKDALTAPFSMREFKVQGKQFAINGQTVFLRGKHDAAVFPLTGHTPMNVEDWLRVCKIAKSYGINHFRFHSYCPPEAAFIAADQVGIYMQPELPFWGGLDVDSIADMLREEGYAMLKAYANHPSFVMFSHGNEIWSGHDRVERNILDLKTFDSRPLYTMGANNNIGYVPPRECSDFFIGARTPYRHDTILTHTRLTHAFADSRDGGILNSLTPSTEVNFDYPVSQMNIPLISHEIGQYQIFPDYREIDKYSGVVKAWNLEVFRKRLEKAGMGHLDSLFQQASGAWSALCYKAEMEAAFRTKDMAGFQLLDLQDFSGQGTALVGILDAFMDSKGVISPEAWRQSCNEVVVLLEFPKYCWTQNEHFKAKVQVANYSPATLKKELIWEIKNRDGAVLFQGAIPGLNLANGLSQVGEIEVDLSSMSKAEKLVVNVSLPGTGYSNSYPLWVYPDEAEGVMTKGITVAEKLTRETLDQLTNGASVLLFPKAKDVQQNSLPGLFPPDFWNYGMFKGISENNGKPVSPGTLGLLTDPGHPLFRDFPTDFHTNWQWFSIIKNSRPLILDKAPKTYFPVVQVIDNLERNHKLGLIFECKVGRGKLLVCMSNLPEITEQPEARQLYQSIVNYMTSANFDPEYEVTNDLLLDMLNQNPRQWK